MEQVSAPITATVPLEQPLETGPVKVPMPSEKAGSTEQQAPAQFPGQEK